MADRGDREHVTFRRHRSAKAGRLLLEVIGA
jgi:hypothetical protein